MPLMDLLVEIGRWLLFAFFGAQGLVLVGLVVRVIWMDAVRPRLIPAAEIERAADEIVAGHPDPEYEAFARHKRAWYDGDGAGMAYWHRVRKAVRRRTAPRRKRSGLP